MNIHQNQDFVTAAERRHAIEMAPDWLEIDRDREEENRADSIRDRQLEADDRKGEQP